MSEIEKLYENAEIYPDCRARECGLDYCPNNYGCGYAVYPAFTPAKQLELIKWCLFKCEGIEHIHFEIEKNKVFIHQMQFASTYCDTLEEAIAGFINDMWQDLTAEEQAEIKRILED